MKSIKRTKLIATVVVVYMLIALAWWSILLFNKNKMLFDSYKQIYKLQENNYTNQINIANFEELESKYHRQRNMIVGEGIMFGFILVIGISFIFRAFTKELQTAKIQNNFMLSITHEFKSPLSSIKLILDTFKKRKLDSAQFNELNENAREETSRLERLIDNVLFANKLNYQYNYYFEKANLTELLNSIIGSFKKYYPNYIVTLKSEIDFFALIDYYAMEIAIRNLIENAIKYSNHNKDITVSVHCKNKVIFLRIEDHGLGIPNEEKSKIFDMFYRIGDEEFRSCQGTGLGLFISYQIIKAHKGSINVYDNDPQGSIFEVNLALYE